MDEEAEDDDFEGKDNRTEEEEPERKRRRKEPSEIYEDVASPEDVDPIGLLPTQIHPWASIRYRLINELDSSKLLLDQVRYLAKPQLGDLYSTVKDACSFFDALERNMEENDMLDFLSNLFRHMNFHDFEYENVAQKILECKTLLNKVKPELLNTGIWKYTEKRVRKLYEMLLKLNHELTQRIQVSPLETFGRKMPIDQLYAPVVIREDLEYKHTSRRARKEAKPERKVVETPNEMFNRNGIPVRFVLMQGEAAHGKTTYCLQLLRYWCNAKLPSKVNWSIWEKGLDIFDFVFLITLRHVDNTRSSIVDMICKDMYNSEPECSDTMSYVLANEKQKCLIIIDGIDEWTPTGEVKSVLTHQGIPNINNLPNCTFLLTSRPWKFALLAKLIEFRPYDRVIEIEGLQEKGIKTVISNVLINYFGVDEKSNKIEQCLTDVMDKSLGENVESVMRIPLLLVLATILWYRKETVSNKMTSFYIAFVTMLIEQTFKNKPLDLSILEEFVTVRTTNLIQPSLFQKYDTLNGYFNVLYSLGKVAYEGLISDETRLVFKQKELEKELGKRELEFVLKVGLLSQCEGPSSYTSLVSVNFLHKTVQEFLAAIYISSRSETSRSFCEHLVNIDIILELSNVIVFASGLSPPLGCFLSQQIVPVANTDKDICTYRDKFEDDTEHKVRLVFELQLNCFREMQEDLCKRHNSSDPLSYHVFGVYLACGTFFESNKEPERRSVIASVDLMRISQTYIKLMHLFGVPDSAESGIADDELKWILDNATSLLYLFIWQRNLSFVGERFTSLITLHLTSVTFTRDALCSLQKSLLQNKVLQSLKLARIKCLENGEKRAASLRDVLLCLPSPPLLTSLSISCLEYRDDIQTLVDVLPQLTCLRSIQYTGFPYRNATQHTSVAQAVFQMKQLQQIGLWHISVGNGVLELTSEMSEIQKVVLQNITMSADGWNRFIDSVINIPHYFDVMLERTIFDDQSLSTIRSSPHFTITSDDRDNADNVMVEFSRVIPSTQHGN